MYFIALCNSKKIKNYNVLGSKKESDHGAKHIGVPMVSWTPVLRGAQPVCSLGNNASSKTEMSLFFTG